MFTQQEKQNSSEALVSTRRLDASYFDVAVAAFTALGVALVLAVLEPPRLTDAFDVFATPQVLPEWYLLPAFFIIKSLPSKLIGLMLMGGIVGSLFLLPFMPDGKRLPGGRFLGRAAFVAIHVGVITLGFLSLH